MATCCKLDRQAQIVNDLDETSQWHLPSVMLSTPAWLDRTAWPFAPHTFVHPDGVMHYVDEGQGPLLMLVHGTPTWSFEWRHVVAALRTSHRVLAIDHLGFGLSARPAGANYSPEQHAVRFRAWFEHVVGQAPFAMVVHDFGGPIALPTLFAHAAQCTHAVITNSWAWDMARDPMLGKRIRLVQGRMGRWLYRYANVSPRLLLPSAYGDRTRLTKAVHAQYLAPFPDRDGRERVLYGLARSLVQSAPFFEQLRHALSALVPVPTRLFWGMRDSVLPASMLAEWQQLVPHADVERFATAGHWPHEEEPEHFVRALRAFLNPMVADRGAH